jgi:hypothetical protein
MKLLAIIDVTPGTPVETIRRDLVNELKGSWDLFTAGVLREAYLTNLPSRAVFVLEAGDIAEAQMRMQALPLVAAGAMRVELIELRPFANWAKLFAA